MYVIMVTAKPMESTVLADYVIAITGCWNIEITTIITHKLLDSMTVIKVIMSMGEIMRWTNSNRTTNMVELAWPLLLKLYLQN